MVLDPSTVFVMLVATTVTCMLVLFWGWLQNRHEGALLWLSGGYAAVMIGNFLVSARGRLPDFMTIDIANSFTIYGFALGFVGIRAFNRRTPMHWLAVAAVLVWLALALIPALHSSYEWRVIVISSFVLAFAVLSAVELMRERDGLRTRYPVAILLGVHAIALLTRIAFSAGALITGDVGEAFDSGWFVPLAIEAVIFAQALAITMLVLTKERVEAQLRSAALTDPLTAMPNRRAFFERGTALLALNCRHHRPTSVILFDLDHFKGINDTYGHAVGDAVLRLFAESLRAQLRAGDCAGRIGGEEFAVLLPDTDEVRARIAATRMMRAFAEATSSAAYVQGTVTTSAGLAGTLTSDVTIEELLSRADAALYEAKRQGGNVLRTIGAIAPDVPPPRISMPSLAAG